MQSELKRSVDGIRICLERLNALPHLFCCYLEFIFSHISFGVGPRNCLGESLAKSRLVLYIGTLVQQFDIQPGSDHVSDDPSQFQGGLILQPQKFLCKFVPREHNRLHGDL